MRFGNRLSLPRLLLALLLAVALLGVAVQECAAFQTNCKSDCCLPTPACLSLNFTQAPASAPEAPSAAPAAQWFLLAVLCFIAVLFRISSPLGFSFVPIRSDPGGWRAPSRAQLRCWTL